MELQLNNGVYYGDVVDGKLHGIGKIVFNNGNIYIGQLQNNKYSGYGYLELADGQSYNGGWLNGMKHGKGVLDKNDFTYIGNFENGKISGSGYMKLKDGTIIIGNWKDGLLFGENSFYYPNNKHMRKYFNNPGSDVSMFSIEDHYDKTVLTNKLSELEDQIKKEYSETQNKVLKHILSMSSRKSYVVLIAQFRDAFNAKNYLKAIELLEQANDATINTEEKNYCKLYKFLCKASIAYQENNLNITLNQLHLAKRIYDKEPCGIFMATKNEIDKQIKNLDHRIHLEDMIAKLEQGCKYYNNNQVEKALEIFTTVKRHARNQDVLNEAKEKIKLCEDFIKERNRIAEENKIIDEINSYYKKAYEFEEQERYEDAIRNYKLAIELVFDDDDKFIDSCNRRIEACQEQIEEAKEREEERERERIEEEREEREALALQYFNDGIDYYYKGYYLQAMSSFSEASRLTNDFSLECDCNNYITQCRFSDEP